MPVEIHEDTQNRTLEVPISGKLTRDDYERFLPAIERLIEQQGKIRLLVRLHDFEGWSAGALWEDIKFDVRHFNDIERLAIVGETKWQEGMSVFCKPFTTAKVRYFDQSRLNDARAWLNQSD